ncbi:DUF1643 domain-containing protein [Terrihalobacillus insolitus]|uniref:DUF1643 domain-containing protein n=1 Tax=Terrihalobacillus insolitus TaxID=2950438 RepID=UPI003A94F7E1
MDKSVMLFMNFCIGAKYGGMFIVNLWSYRTQSEKELIRIAYSKRHDVNTDNWIRQAVNESEKLYIGWGSNKNRKKRINQFKELLNRCKKINIVRLNTEDDRMVHLSRSTVNKKERIITINQI